MIKYKVEKVFIDLDGIIVNMIDHIIDTLNLNKEEILNRWPKDIYWINEIIGVTKDDINDIMNYRFWITAQHTVEAEKIMGIIKRYFIPGTFAFLTSPTDIDGCIDGKRAWVKKYYPGMPLIVTEHKYFCASANKLLIDDFDQNVSQFIEHGGKAILYPRLWNSARENIDFGLQILETRIKELTCG